MNMLFVDKDQKMNEVFYPLLARKNHAEYKIVKSSTEAIQILKSDFIPDFVFLEYDIPPGNAMDVIFFIQTRDYKDKVKIFLTTDLNDYEKVETLATNMNVTFDRKPLQLFKVQAFIDENYKIG